MKHKSITIKQAKCLRKNMTSQEWKLWDILRNSNVNDMKFRRQVPIGNYVADFVCEAKNLIIELDGGQHALPEAILYDKERTKYFETQKYKVIRFWNNEIDNNIDGVIEKIIEYLK